MQVLPIKLTKIGRTAINGSFFNFYLCQFQGNVVLPERCQRQPIPLSTTTRRRQRGVTSDERPLPRAQPRHDRCHRHRRLILLILVRLQGRRPAAHRWRRHLPRRLRRGGRAEAQRRGARRRRPGRQGHRGRARRRPRGRRPSRSTSAVEFGTETVAAIKVKTLLGAMFIALEPAGLRPAQGGLDDPAVAAPRRRTTSCRRSPGWPTAPSRSTPTGWRTSLNTLGDLTKDTPRRSGRPARASPTSRTTSRAATSSSTRCCSNTNTVSAVLGDRTATSSR